MSRVESLLLAADPLEVFPPAPALADRIEIALRRRRRTRRRLTLLAVASLAALALAVLSPTGRSALSPWFGIGGVRIERTDELPAADYRRRPDLGRRVSVEQARALVPYRLRVLPRARVGRPTAVYFRGPSSHMVTFVCGSLERPRLLLSQWRLGPDHFQKVLPRTAPVEHVMVGAGAGYWVRDAHAIFYLGPQGEEHRERLQLSAPALVWVEHSTSFRLEANVSRTRAPARSSWPAPCVRDRSSLRPV